jgi:DNA-binding transcriptional regulator YdaS (Cro superfamily)
MSEKSNPDTPFKLAIDLVTGGNRAAFAREIDLSKGYVGDIARERRPVPANKCLLIQQLTKGRVTAKDLRPDIFAPDDVAA